MRQFDMADLDRDGLTQAAKDAMLDLILAWAHLDGMLSLWVGVKFGLRPDKTAILLGRSDAQSKLLKLQRLYAMEGADQLVPQIRAIRKSYEKQVAPRNTMAHASCRGCLKSEPDRIVFAAFEAVKLGEPAIDAVPIEVMERSTRWANLLSERVEKIINVLDPLPAEA
ncbi:MAG TPA: hypothetical protein VF628_05340 [Allosphingosinicella sp.]|jgi:hypothetical protein